MFSKGGNVMNLGKKIVEIRKKNKMSQEDFAEIFNITRQTVSSWENSKSYPDIETLVKISDRFNISLDVLLKEDKKMIKELDKKVKNNKKYKRILIIVLALFLALILILGIYTINYKLTKNRLEKQFDLTLKENKFYKNGEGIYQLDLNDKVTYAVPNQKMPSLLDFSLHFYAKQLHCTIKLEDDKNLIINWLDNNYFGAHLYDRNTKEGIFDTGLLSSKNVDQISIIKNNVDIDEKLLKEVIKKGNSLYNDFYK